MVDTWKMNKEIPFGFGTARFYTLYTDGRDAMCDSYLPQWEVSHQKRNRMVVVYDTVKREEVFRKMVTKEEGNATYKEMAKLDRHGYGAQDCREWVRKSKLLTVEGLAAEFEANGWEETIVTCPDGATAKISPCCYYGEKNLQNCEYFLLYWDIPWGGSDKIEKLVDQLNRHAELKKENDRDKEELRSYFEEHQASGWDGESFSFYSDWHKDLFGYRPHGKVFGQYINPHAV